jgi:glycine hydroxymethyltransferase
VQIADVTTTTTHKTLRGPRAGLILAKANPELEKKLNSAVFPGGQGGPLEHAIAAKAVAFKEAMEPAFVEYQKQVVKNAQTMAQVFMQRGYDVVSKGTDDHLFLVSFIEAGLTGKSVDAWLGAANITVNMNAVPNDPQSPFVTSGIRVGTPAVTTRGFGEDDCRELAGWMCDVIDSRGDSAVIEAVKAKALDICARYPVYE